MGEALARFFKIKERKSTVEREVKGGIATFLTMSYILFVNPSILQSAGIPLAAVAASTALAAGLTCLLMGVVANFPLALASGMGLNSVVAFQIAASTGSWQSAMGLVVIDGLVVLLLVATGLREAVMNALPRDLKIAIGVGIGLFIAFIGLVNARIVIVPPGTLSVLAANPSAAMPPVTIGSLHTAEVAVTGFGLFVTAFALIRKWGGAIVLGIVCATLLALLLGVSSIPRALALPDFSAVLQADVVGALQWKFVPLLVALIVVDFFDTIGTVTAIAEQGNLLDSRGRVPKLKQILGVDALGACIGGLMGASSVTAYIESAAGVAEGARTGLHSVVVGLLFLVAIFAAPLAAMVPACATAPALIIVGFLMCSSHLRSDPSKLDTAIPAFITMLVIPLTFSIAHGIGFGILSYTVLKLVTGRARDLHPVLIGTAVVFAAYFACG